MSATEDKQDDELRDGEVGGQARHECDADARKLLRDDGQDGGVGAGRQDAHGDMRRGAEAAKRPIGTASVSKEIIVAPAVS